MSEEPLLAPAAKLPTSVVRDTPAALVACIVGLVSVVVASSVQLAQDQLFSVNPDVRITAPFFIAALIAAVTSLVRRERAFALSIGGLALAGSAMALGWILLLSIVAVVAAIVIYILSEVM